MEVLVYIGFLEMFDGCVKILYLKIYVGLFVCCDDVVYVVVFVSVGIGMIDFFVVNFYLFQVMVVDFDCCFEDVIENIDIGGLVMLCLVVKNYVSVVVVVDFVDYVCVLVEICVVGQVLDEMCFGLVVKVFVYMVVYDGVIVNYFFLFDVLCVWFEYLEVFSLQFIKFDDLCYGENLYQMVVFYCDEWFFVGGFVVYWQLQGKEFLYNNIVDGDVVWECVKSFGELVCVIVKYVNFCGVVVVDKFVVVYDKVFRIDLVFVFGGIIVFNCVFDVVMVEVLGWQFVEVVIVLCVEVEVQKLFVKKFNLCLFEVLFGYGVQVYDYKCVGGGFFVQMSDLCVFDWCDFKVVIKVVLSEVQWVDFLFVWCVVKYVKFNVIVFCGDGVMFGVGVGQMSCVDSVCIVVFKVQGVLLFLVQFVVVFDVFFFLWWRSCWFVVWCMLKVWFERFRKSVMIRMCLLCLLLWSCWCNMWFLSVLCLKGCLCCCCFMVGMC